MRKMFLFLSLSCIVFPGYCQNEQVYLQLNKYSAVSGDTIFFKGYVLKDRLPTKLSTNLYTELFNRRGILLASSTFPIFAGESIGQIVLPDSLPTDNYYIRAFTRYQLNFDSTDLFDIPIYVSNILMPGNAVPKRQKIPTDSDKFDKAIELSYDSLDIAPDGNNSWKLKISDSSLYTFSISITDADKSRLPPTNIYQLKRPHKDLLIAPIKQVDTGYISFSGMATKISGKKIKNPFSEDLFIAGVKDSNFVFARVIHMDSVGHFNLDSLFFFDNMDLEFQVNKPSDGTEKNLKLNLFRFMPPFADSLSLERNWQDDSVKKLTDTLTWSKKYFNNELSKTKILKPVEVTARKSVRKELDNKYTSGAFSEPALYSFDVRTEKRYADLGSYLRANYPRFQGGISSLDTPRDVMNHQFLFFVDEHNYTWEQLQMFDWRRIAYIKCFESDFIADDDFIRWSNNMMHGFSLQGEGSKLKSPVSLTPIIIAIYTRKDADFRSMEGGLNKITVKGYTSILPFHPDGTTLLWEPLLSGKSSFQIRFRNSETAKRFRIVIEGVNDKGELVHLEKIFP